MVIAGILYQISDLLGSLSFVVYGLYGLAVLLPIIMLCIRRLHDIDKSGWFLLLGFIPVVGALILLYFYILKGTDGANRFGDPEPISDGPLSIKNKQ